MGEPVAVPFQLAVGDRFTALRHDDGWLVRSTLGVQTWIHRALPCSEAEDAPQDRYPLKSTEDMSISTATVAVPKRPALPLTFTSGWASQDRPPATPSQRLKTDGPRALELQASALILVHNQVNQKKARPFQALD